MKNLLKSWPLFFSIFTFVIFILGTLWIQNTTLKSITPWSQVKKHRSHVDHTVFFKEPLKTGEDVTKRCLDCHKDASHQVMETAHWNWKDKVHGLGKSNLLNNFCIGIKGNYNSCTKCHVGYGWSDAKFDFKNPQKVDCLVCHEWSGQYIKGVAGIPVASTNLQLVAQSVGYPKRENCSNCHAYGGGGLGVKHGDLDTSLLNPTEALDVHMGRHGFLCIDCHKTEKHDIPGKAFSVSLDHNGGISCTNCHQNHRHQDQRLNLHLESVACQTCHIPSFARKQPTKMNWDWSKAGDSTRKDDPHHYLKIKGEFKYETNVIPKYYWFNETVERYLLGDRIDPLKVTDMNRPKGSIKDPKARIWPFKIHDAQMIYDVQNKYLLQPITGGEGGFWKDFNWNQALRLAEPMTGLKYSGKHGFAPTRMYWPLSHMVTTKEKALSCNDCHGETQKRIDWKELGYENDPLKIGGRWKTQLRGEK